MQLLPSSSLDRFASPSVPPGRREPSTGGLPQLAPRDQVLLELALQKQLTRRQIARALDLDPGHISRRVRRALRLMQDPLTRALTATDCKLGLARRQVGIDYFVYRLPISVICRRRNLRRDDVRAMLQYILGWHEGTKSDSAGRSAD